MLQELLDLADTLDFEGDGGVIVVSAAYQGDKEDLELMLEVHTDDDEPVQKWSIICRSQRENTLVLGWSDFLEITSDHVVLWPHTQTVCSLWFNGSGQNAPAVVGELWREHQELVGD